ncbi:MAG: gluconate 2-dehydrogenase subunit 3 family protein [Arenicella sp.]|nr:gluconate 2-dehydrogenase subunit 3 family protein [Arenicella sp.]
MPWFTTRRKFLLLSGAGIAAMTACRHSRPPTPAHDRGFNGQNTVLNSIIDALVPSDEFAGALDIGVHRAIEAEMQQKPGLQERVERLTAAVNSKSLATHRQTFEQLSTTQREALLNEMLQHTAPRQARTDLKRLRNNVLIRFYSSDGGHASLNYRLPANYPAYRA